MFAMSFEPKSELQADKKDTYKCSSLLLNKQCLYLNLTDTLKEPRSCGSGQKACRQKSGREMSSPVCCSFHCPVTDWKER